MSLIIEWAARLEGMKAHEMPSAHRLVMALFAQHANEKKGNRAWPSLRSLHDSTGYGRTKLAEVIAELVDFGHLVPDGNVGEGLRRSDRYEVRLDGRPWPEGSRAGKRRDTTKARALRLARRETGTASVSHGDTVASRTASVSCLAPREGVSRTASTNPVGTRDQNPGSEPGSAPARVRAEALPLFSSLEPSTSTPVPASAVREKPRKAPKPPREKTAAEGYADGFVQAFTDRGRTVTRPTGPEQKELGRICQAHAFDRNGGALGGAALPVWIRAQVGAMLDDLEDPERHKGGVSVHGLKMWLNNRGGPVRVRELEPAPAPRPDPSPAEQGPIREPPPMPDEAVLRAARSLPRSEANDAVIAKYEARVAAAVPA